MTVVRSRPWTFLISIAWMAVACSGSIGQGTGSTSGAETSSAVGCNLISNNSFETNTQGWSSWQGTLTRVANSGAPDGKYVAQVTQATSNEYSLNANSLASNVKAGVVYEAGGFVASASQSAAGKPISLVIRERAPNGDIVKTWSSSSLGLTSTFQPLATRATVVNSGDTMEIYVIQLNAVSGDSFYADYFYFGTSSSSPPSPDGGSPSGGGGTPDAGSGSGTGSGVADAGSGPPMPLGVPGSWTLAFDDEFDGDSLDTTKWAADWFEEGGVVNGAATYSSNVSVSGGNLILTLASSNSGASINTESNNGFAVQVGMYAEARILFPGNGSSIYNWDAWWLSGSNWPAGGEHDIAEVLGGPLTVNYHSPDCNCREYNASAYWGGAFHVYGIYRKASSADVYWDGKLVTSYATSDNGAGEYLILNVGDGSPSAFGASSEMLVDYVRVWRQ
jgi:Glycosyl hydrolases family 16/Carbohydrate binding domain